MKKTKKPIENRLERFLYYSQVGGESLLFIIFGIILSPILILAAVFGYIVDKIHEACCKCKNK